MGLMKYLDVPPVWLAVCVLFAWLIRWPSEVWGSILWLGLSCLVAAGCLFVAAVIEFARVRTTIVPRKAPSALITGGIFQYSRNPIYLADLLILAGLALLWGSLVGLLLVPVLGRILHVRFIRGEEERLTEAFGEEFSSYCAQTRRWI